MTNNFPQILENVNDVVRFMHKKNYEQLSESPILELIVLERHLKGLADGTPAQIGRKVFSWLGDVIEQMRPEGLPNLVDVDWRRYLILKNYYVDGQRVDIAADALGLERARFHDLRRDAVRTLASVILQAEKEALLQDRIFTNLDESRRRFSTVYVPRFNDEGVEHVEALLDFMKKGRAWAIALTGGPGVGKTRIAYETAMRCVDERLFDAVLLIWIEDNALRYSQESRNPYKRFAPLAEVLNSIGAALGRRDIRGKEFLQKCDIIYFEMRNKPALVVLDDLHYLETKDWELLSKFLERIPYPSTVLLTSRLVPLVGEKEFKVSGMSLSEAMTFMHHESAEFLMQMPSDGDLEKIYAASLGGVPLVMRFYLGLMASQKQTAEEVLSVEVDNFGFEQKYDWLLDKSYAQLLERDPNSLLILHVLPVFTTPADVNAISAAAGLNPRQTRSSLGLLYRSCLVERQDDHYDLLSITRDFMWAMAAADKPLLDGSSLQEFLDKAYCRLAAHYTIELKRCLVGDQIKLLGTEKKTMLAILEWCHQKNHYPELIGLVDVIGRPLGILGYLDERLEWGQRAMEACEKTGQPHWRDWFAVHDVAWSLVRTDHREEARRLWQESLERSLSNDRDEYRSVKALSLRNLAQDVLKHEPDESTRGNAIAQLKESSGIWAEIHEPEWAGHTLEVLGMAYLEQEMYPEALNSLERAYQYLVSQRHLDGTISTLTEIALVMIEMGRVDDAIRLSDQAIGIAKGMKPPAPPLAYALWRRAQIDARCGKPKETIIENANIAIEIYKACFANPWAEEAKEWMENYTQADPGQLTKSRRFS